MVRMADPRMSAIISSTRVFPRLEAAAKVRRPWQTGIERRIHRWPLAFYGGGIAVLTLSATFGFVRVAHALGGDAWMILPFALVFLLCASQLAVALMNWLSTLLVKPRLLPRWISPRASPRIAARWSSFPR
jgi:cyclic beta-1,2-glucan synthetase